MIKPIRIHSKIRFDRVRKGRKVLKIGEAIPASRGRVPRVTKFVVGITPCAVVSSRFEKLIRDGEVRDYADLARLGHVTRARLTQIMNLLNLAPDIQEQILFLPVVEAGDVPIHERQLRPIVQALDRGRQRRMWAGVGVDATIRSRGWDNA